MSSRATRVGAFIVLHLFRAIWVATMVLTPLFGFWLASSLAAYQNATQWLALLVGLLLFPLVPVGWELFYAWRRSKQEAPKKAILTRLDRLVLRTLLVNGAFLAITLWMAHATAFRAIAVRGDWMLDGHHGPIATTVRGWLLAFADRLDEKRASDHGYGKSDKAPDPWDVKKQPEPPPPPPTPDAPAKPAGDWPLVATIDPLVSGMPEQPSIEAAGQYLAAKFSDKKQLVKAIHDYVALRLTYDDSALEMILKHDYKNVPSQEAEDVFARRTAVCEGYSRLMVAMGKAAGIEIAYVTGHIRDAHRRLSLDETGQPDLEGVGHAWNAVKIDEHWYLIDTTWDDGDDGEITTTYLFTPPKLLTHNHLPEESAWQLRADPITLGEFVRQPLLSPSIGKYGLDLASPTRSQISVDGDAELVLDNPQNAKILATARRDGEKAGKQERCAVETTANRSRITCTLSAGEWEVQLFAAHDADVKAATGRYSLEYVGSILVNRR